jgi:Flp pilus assembly protein TadG
VVTVWIILAGPAFLALLVFVLEVANIWLARVELENALGATALAAVKEWGDAGGGDTLCPRDVGVAYAAANTLVGVPLSITNNYRQGPPNENDLCTGNLIFGAIVTQEIPYVFDASVTPSYAVRAQATVEVKSLFCELCGISLGPFFVTAKETAVYDCQTRCPRLIKINPENFYCPGPAPLLP